ncbi:MAG: DUF3494 domain-containing protein [Spirochaetia bacterium]|nr:DUF3494 domain-containing protein [Spirochaetia bacterium]
MKKLLLAAAGLSLMFSLIMLSAGCTKDSPSSPAATSTSIPTPIATTAGAITQATVVLGTASVYAVLSSSAITNVPNSAITGDVGLSPGVRSDIAGLTVGEVNGSIYASDDSLAVANMLILDRIDALNAYNDAVNAGRGTATSIAGNLNGLTLAPGLYESGSSIEISPGGILYLDAQGNADGVFIFRSATSITTESTSEVVLAGGAQAGNIFWVAGSAITLGTDSKMKGTLIASTSNFVPDRLKS